MSVYDDWKGDTGGDALTVVERDGHTFHVTRTNFLGCSTGRFRYRVRCVTCNNLLHHATTGPDSLMGGHLDHPEYRGSYADDPDAVSDDDVWRAPR